MGCSCLLRKDNILDINQDVKNEENDVPNPIDIENNNKNIDSHNNYNNIIINNKLKVNNDSNKNLGSGLSEMANKRAKSTPLNKDENNKENNSENDVSNDIEYKQIESDLITTQELQEFLSKNNPLEDSIEVELRPTTLCENKTIYYGEWDKKNNKRHGRGIQVWPDGAKYLGYWKNNQANGQGKLIHQDGDIYEGDWQSDKPNGTGCYILKPIVLIASEFLPSQILVKI